MEAQATKIITYVLLKKKDQVFLVQYAESPNPKRSGWWIPAPELPWGKHPDDAAMDIVRSLGISTAAIKFHHHDSFVTRDWHLLFCYRADVTEEPTIQLPYAKGQWFALTELPPAEAYAHGQWEKNLILRLASQE